MLPVGVSRRRAQLNNGPLWCRRPQLNNGATLDVDVEELGDRDVDGTMIVESVGESFGDVTDGKIHAFPPHFPMRDVLPIVGESVRPSMGSMSSLNSSSESHSFSVMSDAAVISSCKSTGAPPRDTCEIQESSAWD